MPSQKLLKWPPPPPSSNCLIWRSAQDKRRIFQSSCVCVCLWTGSLKFLDTICSSASNILNTHIMFSSYPPMNIHLRLKIAQHYKCTNSFDFFRAWLSGKLQTEFCCQRFLNAKKNGLLRTVFFLVLMYFLLKLVWAGRIEGFVPLFLYIK